MMPKGKYAAVLKDVPRLLGTEPDYQTKVEAVKQEMLDHDPRLSTFAKTYAEIRAEKDAAQDVLGAINLRLEAVTQLLIAQMEDEGLTSLKLDTGRAISTWAEPYPQVVDKEAFRLWCVENGFEKSLQLWPSTTAALVKERMLNGEPEPPGIEVYAKNVIRLGSER